MDSCFGFVRIIVKTCSQSYSTKHKTSYSFRKMNKGLKVIEKLLQARL